MRTRRKERKRSLLTKEGACGEDGNDKGLVGGGDHPRVGGRVGGTGFVLSEGPEPVVHGNDTGDGTGVVAVEDAAKGGEGDHEDANGTVLRGGGTDACACYCGTAGHCG